MYFGVCVTILVTASWVAATHCVKFLYIRRNISHYPSTFPPVVSTNDNYFFVNFDNETDDLFQPRAIPDVKGPSSVSASAASSAAPVLLSSTSMRPVSAINHSQMFNAPFFASWFCTNFAILFFPIYLLGRLTVTNCNESPAEILGNIIRGFRDRGFTIGRFLNRCIIFCLLWLITTYLYILSLRALLATDVMALFATNVACAYLLSWVILHEQFVGVRVSVFILSLHSSNFFTEILIGSLFFFSHTFISILDCRRNIGKVKKKK